MLDGFIPNSRATLMLDVVALAMVAILPLMAWSIYLVRFKRDYARHRKVNLAIALTLLGAVTLFEIDMRIFGWRHLAEASSLYNTWVDPVLYVHLVFAVATAVLWIITVVPAMKRFKKKPEPNSHSAFHRRVAKFAAAGMVGTAVTGWVFYVTAFVM